MHKDWSIIRCVARVVSRHKDISQHDANMCDAMQSAVYKLSQDLLYRITQNSHKTGSHNTIMLRRKAMQHMYCEPALTLPLLQDFDRRLVPSVGLDKVIVAEKLTMSLKEIVQFEKARLG